MAATAQVERGQGIKGKITATYTAWCSGCDEWEHLEGRNRERAAVEARRKGWSYLKIGSFVVGWTCPKCKNKSTD